MRELRELRDATCGSHEPMKGHAATAGSGVDPPMPQIRGVFIGRLANHVFVVVQASSLHLVVVQASSLHQVVVHHRKRLAGCLHHSCTQEEASVVVQASSLHPGVVAGFQPAPEPGNNRAARCRAAP
ncbi:MAG: hypothetical protein AB7K09_25365 [Planctomycetota bacterium]